MHYIIETEEQLSQIPKSNVAFIQIILLNDLTHPALTAPCLVYFKLSITNKSYMICVNHPESLNISWEKVKFFLNKIEVLWCYDVVFHKYFLNNHSKIQCINKGSFNINEFNTLMHDHLYKSKYYHVGLNQLIPISKHYEKYNTFYSYITMPPYDGINVSKYDVFYNIEKNGIGCDPKKINKYFELNYAPHSLHGNKIYTKYNLFNKTTRPTNNFNGINFSAIPKEKRDAFEPTNYTFVELDFNGYHPRLLNNMFDIPFDVGDNIYEFLAKEMNLSIDEAKITTFKQLYGGITYNTPFFNEAKKVIDKLWINIPPIHELKVDPNMNPYKLLNYKLQHKETTRNINVLYSLFRFIESYRLKTKIVLYNYDSFLLDMPKDELRYIEYFIEICERNDGKDTTQKYKVKVSMGDNYGNLTRI
jgi:hypothetical protein